MISDQTIKELHKLINGTLLIDESMKNHTSFRIGGHVDALIIPKEIKDLQNILQYVNMNNIPFFVIGNGTKLLVSDTGVEGIIIKIKDCFEKIRIKPPEVIVEAGYPLSKLSKVVADRGLSGLEFAVGIPGTLGGGIVMNAGAHGGNISDVIKSVYLMTVNGKINSFSKNVLGYDYRKSILQNNKMIVLKAKLILKQDDKDNIIEVMKKNIEWRKKTQPLDYPNAGSIFKNTKIGPAGKLIDMAGLKGLKFGDVQISEKHANFMINMGNAKASDVQKLINFTKKEILRKFHVKLESEIQIIGRNIENNISRLNR